MFDTDITPGQAYVAPRQTPSTYQVFQDLQRQNEMHRAQQEQERQREEARQNTLMQYMGQAFDPKDFDGMLGQLLATKRAQYAQMIKDNKGMQSSDLALLMQKDLGNLSQYNQTLKMGREAIKAQAEALKQYKGIDYASAEKVALKRWLMNQDGTMKGVDELGDPQNIVQKEIYARPDLYLTKDATLWDDLKNAPVGTQGKDYEYVAGNRSRTKKSYDFGWYQPYQKIEHEEGKDPVIVPRSTQATGMDGQPLYMDKEKKQPLMIADETAYRNYISNPVRELDLRRRYLQSVEAQHFGVDSPAAEILMRKMVLDDIKQLAPVKNQIKELEKAAPINITNKTSSGSGAGAAGSKEVNIRDIYAEVKDAIDKLPKGKGLPMNALSGTAQTAILRYAKELIGNDAAGNPATQKDIYLAPVGNKVAIKSAKTGKVVATLDYEDINTKGVNTSSKERQKVLQTAKENKAATPSFVFPHNIKKF